MWSYAYDADLDFKPSSVEIHAGMLKPWHFENPLS